MAAAPLPAGFMLRDYRILKVIGRGGFGLTYLAEDVEEGAPQRPWGRADRLVAIKEYVPLQGALRLDSAAVEPADDSRETTEMFTWGYEKFTDEARLLARVSSKREPVSKKPIAGFAQAGPFFEENNTAYIVMEYISGGSLRTQFDRSSLLDEASLTPFLRQLVNALGLIHEDGIWHRDIKPQNILMRVPAGVEEPPPLLDERTRSRTMPLLLQRDDVCPVLIDFGAARTRPSVEGVSVSVVGTEGYAPPEQFEGRAVGPWSDIYAVSAVAYRAMTGQTPTPAHQRQTAFLRTGYDPLEPAQRAARASGTPGFLMALDWGLWIEPDLRPQTLTEWSPVLFGSQPASRKVLDHFLIESLVDRTGEAEAQVDPAGDAPSGDLPIVDEATGDPGAVIPPLDVTPPEDREKPPAPRGSWMWAAAIGAIAVVGLGAIVLGPGLKPPSPPAHGPVLDNGIAQAPSNSTSGSDANTATGRTLKEMTISGSQWTTADLTSLVAGTTPRWVSVEASAPVRLRVDGKVYLLDGEGLRLPDLNGKPIELKPVDASGGSVDLTIREGEPPAP